MRLIKIIGFWGWLLVVLGVASEGIFEALQYRAEGQLQTFNDILLADAQRNAGSARTSAVDAANAASLANSESEKATVSSANAIALARGARREADAYAQEITAAKEQSADASSRAADAVSRLSDAEQRLGDATQREADAEEKLNSLKTPRTLRNASDFSAALKQFEGTEYTFSMCFADDESISLLMQIDSALQAAGWKRVAPSPPPVIQLNIFGDKLGEGVAEGTLTGIEVSVDSTESIDSLRATKTALWPKSALIAVALKNALGIAIDPPSEDNVRKAVVVTKGSSTVVRISVGKKP